MTRKPVVLIVGACPQVAAQLRKSASGENVYHLIEADTEQQAVSVVNDLRPSVVMVNSSLRNGCPLSICDYVAFRCPDARVIFQMDHENGFFDGSLFAHASNAQVMLTPGMHSDDVSAVVAHHAEDRISA